MVVQWLRLHASISGGKGWIPSQGIKILHTSWCSQKFKKISFLILDIIYNI